MDKSRNNEIHDNPTGRKLMAIEKNNNILERTKSSYVKRSFYFTRYKESPIAKFNHMKKISSCTNKISSSFNLINSNSNNNVNQNDNNASLSRTNSRTTINVHRLRNNKSSMTAKNSIKPIVKLIKDRDKNKIHEFVLSAKLKNTNTKLDQIKDSNSKCLMYIENLISKRKNENQKAPLALLKDTEKHKEIIYYDQELPMKYKNYSQYNFNIILRPRHKERDKSAQPSLIKMKYCDKLLNSISRRVDLYNDKNEYIREEEVANDLNGIEYKHLLINCKSNLSILNSNTKSEKNSGSSRMHSFILQNYEIDPQLLFPQSSYEEIMNNRKLIQNKEIKKRLSNYPVLIREHIEGVNIINYDSNHFKLSNDYDKDNDKDRVNTVLKDNHYNSLNASLRLINNSKSSSSSSNSPFKQVAIDSSNKITNQNSSYNRNKNNQLKFTEKVKVTEKDKEIEDTIRTLEKILPKGLKENITITPFNFKSLHSNYNNLLHNQQKANDQNKNKKYNGLSSSSSSNTSFSMQKAIKDECIKTLFGSGCSVTTYLNNFSMINYDTKTPIITKIQKKTLLINKDHNEQSIIEESKAKIELDDEAKRLKLIKEEEDQIEQLKQLQQQKLLKEQELIRRRSEDYQRFVTRKILEEEERIKRKNEENERNELANKEAEESKEKINDVIKSSFFDFYNTSNQESLLSHFQPKEQIKNTMVLKKDLLSTLLQNNNINANADSILNKNKKKKIKEKKLDKESFEKKYMSRLDIDNNEEEEDVEGKPEEEKKKQLKRKRALLKLQHDINYVLQDSEYKEESNNEDNNNDHNAFNEFKNKLESLRKSNEQDYAKYLENNYEELQEEMENVRRIQKKENRINSFLRDMDYSLNRTKERKKCIGSYFKMQDYSKCDYSSSSLF